MASKAVVDAVNARLVSNWTATPIVDSNMQGEPSGDAGPFLTVQYPIGSEEHVGMAGVGNRTFRETGVIRIVLSIARGQGIGQGLGWAETLRALFRAQTFDGVACLAPSPPIEDDRNDSGNYYVMSFACPYYYDLNA